MNDGLSTSISPQPPDDSPSTRRVKHCRSPGSIWRTYRRPRCSCRRTGLGARSARGSSWKRFGTPAHEYGGLLMRTWVGDPPLPLCDCGQSPFLLSNLERAASLPAVALPPPPLRWITDERHM